MSEPREITNPFPGLRPFETDEYRLFFGREGQSDELISRLGRTRFLAVVGTSGSGKSSLVRAGLLPALRGGMMAGVGAGWRIAVMRPGGDPVGNLARVLAERGVLEEAGGGLPAAEAEAVIEATLRGGSLGLVEAVRQARLAGQEKLLVIADQFEELFRFRAARAASSTDDASAFVKLLVEAARQRDLNVYVVLTMRSDFLGDCSQFQGLPEAINDGQYLIPRMTRDERRAAIVGPVRVARGRMGEPLVNRLLNDVGDNPDQLPILQHALMRTWDYWHTHRRDGEPLGLEHYAAIGTMAGALSEHADEAFNELPDERGRQIAELLFKALTERGADNREIRRPTRLSEVCKIAGAGAEEVAAVVEVFRREGRSFLMPPAGAALTPDTVLDISHESLIRNWERLKAWVDEEAQSARIYKRLAEAAALNRKGEEGLLQDPGLQFALDWREKSKPNAAWGRRYHPEFDTAVAYLDESRAAQEAALAETERRRREEIERERHKMEQTRAFAEQQARSARRLRWAAVAMAVLFVLSLGTAAYAYRLKQFAQDSAENAQRSEADARKESRRADEERKSALEARDRAEEARLAAETLKNRLEENYKELKTAQAETGRQADLASDRARQAEQEKKNALAAQDTAEKASADAIAANKLAAEASERTRATAHRGDLLLVSFLSSKSNIPVRAAEAFGEFAQAVDDTLKKEGGSLSQGEVKNFKLQMGLALENRGAQQLKWGDVPAAKTSYERSRDIFEEVFPKSERMTDMPNSLLFDMYQGLGHSYHGMALKGGDEASGYFKQAEAVFLYALEVQKAQFEQAEQMAKETDIRARDIILHDVVAQGAEQVAADYRALAHLYRDMERRPEAAHQLAELINFLKERKDADALVPTWEKLDADALVAARKELAEFYRDQNLFLGAEKAYKELIDEQEARSRYVEDYEKRGPEIVESYSELAEVYRAQETKIKSDKAEDAFAAANAIQRLVMRLRRIRAMRNPQDSDMKADSADDPADAAGDAYVKLGKPGRALALYEYAFEMREEGSGAIRRDLWKSYDKLTRLYRRNDFKDFAKAEHYNQLLIQEVTRNDPQSAKAAGDAVALCAQLYAKDPDRYAEAASYYERAVKLYESQGKRDWMTENTTLYTLSELYGKLKLPPEQTRAARRRLEVLAAEMNKIAGLPGTLPRGSITLVREYAEAVRDAAYFYGRDKNVEEAAAVYQRAFEAYDFVTKKIYFVPALESYARMLDGYAGMLDKQGRKGDAAKVVAAARGLLKKVEETKNIQEQQTAQQTHQGAPPSSSGQ
ncbi:MAG TPA: hypothetical protein VKB12_13210 [Pyrinomonadaceae bacterium]|nr:hypothetical protein [Pyrinomonadaceae bacterium]